MSVIEKILEGMYSGFIPTTIGVFLGILCTEIVNKKRDKKLYYKILDNAVIEQIGLISRNNLLSKFLIKREENKFVSSPTEFVRINLQSFPAHIDLLNANITNKYTKPTLIHKLLLERRNLEVLKQKFLIDKFDNDDEVLNHLNSYNEMLFNLIWIEYQMSQNNLIQKDEIKIQKLIDYVQEKNSKESLDLNKLKIK